MVTALGLLVLRLVRLGVFVGRQVLLVCLVLLG